MSRYEITVEHLAHMRTKEINQLFKENNISKDDASKLRYQRRRFKIKEYSKIHHQRVKDTMDNLEREREDLAKEFYMLQAEVSYLKRVKWCLQQP